MPSAEHRIACDDIFEHIIAVADDFWTYLHRNRSYYHVVGHMNACGKQELPTGSVSSTNRLAFLHHRKTRLDCKGPNVDKLLSRHR